MASYNAAKVKKVKTPTGPRIFDKEAYKRFVEEMDKNPKSFLPFWQLTLDISKAKVYKG